MAGLWITHEPLNPRYCQPGAIGYIREVKSDYVVAGGVASSETVGPHDYNITARFPDKNPEVKVLLSVADGIGTIVSEGSGSFRMHNGTYCAFGPRPRTTPKGDNGPTIPAAAIPKIKCLHNLLESSRAVQSAVLYVIDDVRSAIEYRFKNSSGYVLKDDLMLLALADSVTYDFRVLPNEPDTKAVASDHFFSSLNADSKCHVSPAFDSTIPFPKPRSEWQRLDWSTLLPVPAPSPTASR